MRDRSGVAAIDDLTLLLVAVVSFSLFFASLAAAYSARESENREDRLVAEAGDLLEAVMTDPRWTSERGLFLAAELTHATEGDFATLAASRRSLVVIWNLETDEQWRFGGGGDLERWTAATSANVAGMRVDPARVVVTVWGP